MEFLDNREEFEELLGVATALAGDLEAKVERIFGSNDHDFRQEVEKTFELMKKNRDA